MTRNRWQIVLLVLAFAMIAVPLFTNLRQEMPKPEQAANPLEVRTLSRAPASGTQGN